MDLVNEVYGEFGFDDIRVELSTRPAKSVGTDATWEAAEAALAEALAASDAQYPGESGRRRLLRPQD